MSKGRISFPLYICLMCANQIKMKQSSHTFPVLSDSEMPGLFTEWVISDDLQLTQPLKLPLPAVPENSGNTKAARSPGSVFCLMLRFSVGSRWTGNQNQTWRHRRASSWFRPPQSPCSLFISTFFLSPCSDNHAATLIHRRSVWNFCTTQMFDQFLQTNI